MLLAIDVGNTTTTYGVWDGHTWVTTWKEETLEALPLRGGNSITGDPKGRHDASPGRSHGDMSSTDSGLKVRDRRRNVAAGYEVHAAICASVVPSIDEGLATAVQEEYRLDLHFLRDGASVGLKVAYETPATVGADRLANALGALDKYRPPIIVVDLGTATNFDVVDQHGVYLGGAIMPGAKLSADA